MGKLVFELTVKNEFRNKKSILITGVAGFIGFSLTKKLIKKIFSF